jgi:hypothetical protein
MRRGFFHREALGNHFGNLFEGALGNHLEGVSQISPSSPSSPPPPRPTNAGGSRQGPADNAPGDAKAAGGLARGGRGGIGYGGGWLELRLRRGSDRGTGLQRNGGCGGEWTGLLPWGEGFWSGWESGGG